MSTGDDDVRSNQQPEESATNEDVTGDLSAYVLDILDEDARERVSSAVSGSARLQDELRREEPVVGLLAHALPRQEPPASLRDRVLQSASQTAAEPIPLESSRWGRVLRWSAAAAAVLIIGLVALNIALWERAEDREDQIANLNQTMSQRDERITELQQIVAAQEQQIAELEGPEDPTEWINFTEPLVWSPLQVTSQGASASGFFCRTRDGSVGWIIVENMPVDPNRVLQAWLIDEGDPIPSATFVTDEEGRGFLIITSDRDLTSFEQIGITVEPPGGSPEPTTPPVMFGDIV